MHKIFFVLCSGVKEALAFTTQPSSSQDALAPLSEVCTSKAKTMDFCEYVRSITDSQAVVTTVAWDSLCVVLLFTNITDASQCLHELEVYILQ